MTQHHPAGGAPRLAPRRRGGHLPATELTAGDRFYLHGSIATVHRVQLRATAGIAVVVIDSREVMRRLFYKPGETVEVTR